MLNEEEDDTSFYVQKTESNMLKSVSGLTKYGNHAEERVKTNRERTTGNVLRYVTDQSTKTLLYISFFYKYR
jgi:hypothetical protein